MSIIRSIREKFNLLIYSNKDAVLRTLLIMSLIISLSAVGLMVYYYGFHHDKETKDFLLLIFRSTFVYYILSYFIRILYSFDIRNYLKQTWIEGLLLFLLLVDGVSHFAFDYLLIHELFGQFGVKNLSDIYIIVVQFYLLTLAALEVGKSNVKISKIRINPAVLFIIIFLGIIVGGAGLLMLPEMTQPIVKDGIVVHQSMDFVEALFTSASATCVTGLMTEEAHYFFSFKGQLILMMLIKIGGLNIVAFGVFFAIIARFGIGVKQHDIIEDIVNKSSYQSSKGLFGKIFIISTLIELIGATCLYFLLPDSPEIKSVGDRIFYSLFHAVSSFNNAGISIYPGGATNAALQSSYAVLSVMGVLIFLGALGFVTILDLINLERIRERLRKPWKTLDIGSRVGLVSGIHLLLFGTIAFMVLEWNSEAIFGDENFLERTISSAFQVVNRTAGFSSVDTGAIGVPMIIVFLLLMFIGGSSSSTAGGIKTSTFTVVMVSVWAAVRGKKNVELFKKTLSSELAIKAYAVMMFTFFNLFLWIFLLTITEADALASGSMGILDLVFEEFSAFSTVGLSTGVTSQFSHAGLVILSISMFIGRLGTLMFVVALSKKVVTTNYKYPDSHMMIG